MATKEMVKPVETVAPKPIKPTALQWQSEGFCWREALVRLPQGATLQDLNDGPTIWRNIQDNKQTALRKWDRVRVVAFDELWFVDATVSHADHSKVVLCGIKKTDMPARSAAMFQDETYKVDWLGSGYGVVRKSDGVPMGNQTFTLPEQAKMHLLSLYRRKVA